MLMKLLTESCRDKTKIAMKYEGPAAIQLSFQALGQVAGMELASSPEVQARMSGFAKHIDAERFKKLGSELDASTAH